MSYLHELTAVSPSGADYAASLTDQPITIIPNGIDLIKYVTKKVNKASIEPNILYIGRLEGRKGVKYLIRAYAQFAETHPEVKLIIAGDGPDREKLELLSEDLNLKNITFLGFISEELKIKLLAEASLFCSPAIFGESFGIVLLEAMSTGAVTVAGNNSGYADLMKGVGAMSIVNPDDTSEFARRLKLLYEEESLQKLWRSWAKDYVQQFDYSHVVDQYEQFYKDSLKSYHERSI